MFRLNTLISSTISWIWKCWSNWEPVNELSCSVGQVKFIIPEDKVEDYLRVFKRLYKANVFYQYPNILNTFDWTYKGIKLNGKH